MSAFLVSESRDSRVAHLFPLGFDVGSWMHHPPDAKYLDTAPANAVLVGLLQLVRFLKFGIQFSQSDDIHSHFKAFAGHSLGVIVAMAAASFTPGDSMTHQFETVSKTALGTLLLTGCITMAFKKASAIGAEESAMASVRGVPQFSVDSVLKKYNAFKGTNAIHLASVDVDNFQFTCSGESATTLAHFIKRVRQKLAATGKTDQSSIPFHQRKPDATIAFHPYIHAPLHCGYLLGENVVEQHMAYAASKGWLFDINDIPFFSGIRAFTNSTNNIFAGMKTTSDLDLTRTIAEYIYTQPVDWPSTLPKEEDGVLRIVDFSPSGGPMPLREQTILNIQGRGIQLKSDDLSNCPISDSSCWRTQFEPKIAALHVRTRLTDLIGLPPVFIGATAPTTRNVAFIAAVARAGYHAELSVDDALSSDELAARITCLADTIPPGHGITVSCRHSNYKGGNEQSKWQLRTVARLRQQNQLPIIGVCVDNSITTTDIAMLDSAGIRYVALRATSVSDIENTLKIAQSCPSFPIMLQWTGGRCGGVHSFEEFHIPLLVEAYKLIRAQSNVVLVANSGFGNADGIMPYLTGSWGAMFNRPYMPFDGIMLCSRIMVSSESDMDDAAKQLIIEASGLDPYDMLALFGEGSAAVCGGIVSICNERGQPVHVVANRAAMLCHKLSTIVLSQPHDKLANVLRTNRDWIVRGLCADYMRPWFGQLGLGSDSKYVELSDMTYIQVIERLVDLMYVAKEQRWIHPTYRNFVAKFVQRTSMRLHNAEQSFKAERKQGVVYDDAVFDEIAAVRLAYPDAHRQLLASADIMYFIYLCKRPGQKAVPFVPVLDADFADYLMRDTEWQCEDLGSVCSNGSDDAAQRVLISQGPVSVQYSLIKNEPVKNIMDGIYNGLVQQISETDTDLPTDDTLDVDSFALLNYNTVICHSLSERTYQLPLYNPGILPSTSAWHRALSGGSTNNWLFTILTNPVIVQNKRHTDNYISRLLRPRYGRTVSVTTDHTNSKMPLSVQVWNSSAPTALELSLTLEDECKITLVLPHRSSALVLKYLYNASTPVAPIHEVMEGRDDRITSFYSDIWRHGTNTQTPAVATARSDSSYPLTYIQQRVPVAKDMSLDMLAIEALPGVFRILTDVCVSPGLLDMVQTEYSVEKCGSDCAFLAAEDELDIVSRVDEIKTIPRVGKQVVAVSDVFRCGTSRKCAEIRATFLFRNTEHPGACFRRVDEPVVTIDNIASDILKVLESKEWFYYNDEPNKRKRRTKPGDTLEFHLHSEYVLSPTGAYLHAATKGTVHLVLGLHERPHIGMVDYEEGASLGNPVIAFLDSHKHQMSAKADFSGTTVLVKDTVTVPDSEAHAFASVSGDHNPHNTSEYFADLAGLPGPVMQGLWTCSSVRQLIELHMAQGNAERMQSFNAQLTGLVYPGDTLEIQMVRAGMSDGQIVIRGYTRNIATGALVLECTARVEQPRTVYVFTGQGSQEVGMGLEWYSRSHVVRSVYDRADQHMRERFGFSIVDIIRDNPKEYTVYFNNTPSGMRIRENYAQFPEIANPDNRSYTFRSPTGLLNATQFAQPAIMLFDVAMAEEMRSRGVFDERALIAGHSLGEYGALAACGIMTLEDIVDITFIRGMTMQSIVGRDPMGGSDFALVAANPSRVSHGFTESCLQYVIGVIRQASSDLLEIVNYNVQGYQYVVAGTRTQLQMLGMVLDFIHETHLSVGGSKGKQIVADMVARLHGTLKGDEIKRGCATIPIPGIDVPFHSSHLLPGAAQFRACIHRMIRETKVDTASLIGRYIPNLTATTFDVSREYFELMYRVTESPVIADELSKWPSCEEDESYLFENKQEVSRLARLLVIELLSYQFASPVLWIETQRKLFAELGARQLIEIGPNSTLCRMAEGTLALLGLDSQVSVLHVLSNESTVFYQDPEEDASPKETTAPAELLPLECIAPSESDPEDPETIDIDGGPPVDVPLTALDIICATIAQKLRVPLASVHGTQTVRELTGGKSTLQNEILGDLLKEFTTGEARSAADLAATVPDQPDELTLAQLAQIIGASFTGSQLSGKHTTMQVARLFSNKMPGAFSQSAFRTALADEFGGKLKQRHVQDGVLLTALTMEPTTRLGGIPAARKWMHSVVKVFAENAGISYASLIKPSSLSSSAKPARSHQLKADAESSTAEGRRLANDKLEAYARYLGLDLRQGHRLYETEERKAAGLQHQVAELQDELGTEFIGGIRPLFDKRKARCFDSYWNWAREDALCLIHEATNNPDQPIHNQAARILALANRADDGLLRFVTALTLSSNVGNARSLACLIRDQCLVAKDKAPVFRELDHPLFSQYLETVSSSSCYLSNSWPPLVHLRSKSPESHNWEYSESLTATYHSCLHEFLTPGVSFAGKIALITGCSKGSIGAHILKRLLSGGARIIATTSTYTCASLRFYESLYKQYGARGSELVVVPYNQGSAADTKALVNYVYSAKGWYLDYLLPFGAVADYGTDVSSLGSRSELSMRVMLTNVLRLLGEVRQRNQQSSYVCRPATLAVLPLSPNHGVFGNDGLYGESKAALETVFNRWESEAWHRHLCVAGAVIGWTRGTGLMAANDAVAPLMRQSGACTFSADEMATNIAALMHPLIIDLAQMGPVWADLNGGLQRIRNVNKVVADAHRTIRDTFMTKRAIAAEYSADIALVGGHRASLLHTDYSVDLLFNHQTFFPQPRKYQELCHSLQGMVNLDKVVVITGYGEIGPYGHAETRWEMEAFGEFSLEGCVELAWIMGLIKPQDGSWVDSQTGTAVKDTQIKAQYEQRILDHTGVRLLEPALLDNKKDPGAVPILRELQVDHDLDPFEATADEAAQFKLRNGDAVDIWPTTNDSWRVRFRRGAVLMVPKALRFDRLVGAQLPTGWDPERYGIPRDIVNQVDPVTCYAICATVESLVRSGITDPYELYQYFHVSQVGSSLGSGAGGVHSIRDMYLNRLTDTPVQSDILQETFANTTVAWINMLLLSSAGVIRPPMGGCGTSMLSMDVAADTIRTGKARVMVAGGFEGFVEQGSYEFAQMGATGSSTDDAAAGRIPREMSRPCTSTRTGFVEAQGAGVVILMSASAALEFGAPVYGIMAHSTSATDKQGVSLPAPGKGILTSAAEAHFHEGFANNTQQLLDIEYRREQIARANSAIDTLIPNNNNNNNNECSPFKVDAMRKAVLDAWGSDFWHGVSEVSPLRGSLAVWGLGVDDIGLASFHGTGTISNDLNETAVFDRQLSHLGRTPGLSVPVVAQKWLTGHPKGPAGAWMLNSALQSMRTGLVPGNRNADNIDSKLQCEYAVFPSRTLQVDKVRACLLKSFGFGQVGAEILVVHPDYFLSTLSKEQLDMYNAKLSKRNAAAYRYWQDTFTGKHTFVQVKKAPPYTQDQEECVLLNPLARAHYNHETNEYVF
ncbi:fatty acid synthase alpha subunit Lsd1 [Coemansia sp. RSA 1843]|nr:fatty acid synthase alpha subunit Lsd1 [Coemansia sp. RSA 1843]